jgi:signal transduction histidine kinase/CheY-like chemotaxis protein
MVRDSIFENVISVTQTEATLYANRLDNWFALAQAAANNFAMALDLTEDEKNLTEIFMREYNFIEKIFIAPDDFTSDGIILTAGDAGFLISIESAIEILRDHPIGGDGYFILIDGDEKILSHPSESYTSLRQYESGAFIADAILQGITFTKFEHMLHGGSYLVITPLKSIDWTLIAVVPESIVYDPINRSLYLIMFTLSGVMLGLLMFTRYFVSRFSSLQDTVTLRQNEKLFNAVNHVAEGLLAVTNKRNFKEYLADSLDMIGSCLNADRIRVWRSEIINGEINVRLFAEWVSDNRPPYTQNDSMANVPTEIWSTWQRIFLGGGYINNLVADMPQEEQEFLNPNGIIKSIAVIPIILQEYFWGFLCIDDCELARVLTYDELDIVRSASLMIASTSQRVEQAEEMWRIEAAEESNRAKSMFLARMSHEIRTPITAVLGIAEIQLQNPNLSPLLEESLVKIHNSASLLLKIVNDILDLSKIESGKMELRYGDYETASMISDVLNMIFVSSRNKDIEFKIFVDENLPAFLTGDTVRIAQIMSNLLSNAFKYTESGLVELSLKNKNTNNNYTLLIISVRDTGLGMTPRQLEALRSGEYTRFHERGNRLIGGTGLGISIVYSLARLMDADIQIESEVGKGTNVVVTIPQKKASDEILGSELAQQLRRFELEARGDEKKFSFTPEPMPYGRVLVVDDVDANLYVAKGLLAFYSLNVESCENGFEAIEKIKQGNIYDIIFMDYMMPGLNGIETMRLLRENGYSQPIVALTANAVIGQAEEFIESGFDDFISKPINTEYLNNALIKFIKDKQPPEVIAAAQAYTTGASIHGYQNNAALQQKLRADFASGHKNTFAELMHAINTNDTETARRLAHNLKSVAALINENNLSEAASLVENSPTEENLSALENEFTRVHENIGVKIHLNEKTQKLFKKLSDLLETRNADCLDLLGELRSIPETMVLVKQIESYNFADALKTLKILRG